MLAKLGGLVAEVAGSMGGATFQRNPNGTIIRSKPLPTYRSSPYSAEARRRLQAVNLLWRTLTPTQRGDWDTFAATQSWYNRFGDVITGTGYMAFLRNNLATFSSKSDKQSVAVQSTYPTTTNAIVPNTPEFYYDIATNRIYLGSLDANTDGNTTIYLYTGPPVPAGRSAYYNAHLYQQRIVNTTALPVQLQALYLALHGRVPSVTLRETAGMILVARDKVTNYPAPPVRLMMVYK
jgi:hypothetical protein